MSKVVTKIKSGHDTATLAKEFKANNYVQVGNAFEENSAENIYFALRNEVFWLWSFNNKKGIQRKTGNDLKKMSPTEQGQMMKDLYINAQENFQFIHYTVPLFDKKVMANKMLVESEIHQIFKFLKSKKMSSFIQDITGLAEVKLADAECFWFQRDHFHSSHKSRGKGKKRRICFELNVTKDFKADWGGMLQMLDDDGHILKGYRPSFNKLNIYDSEQKNSISFVAPFSGEPRLSINGWFDEV